MKLYVRAMTEIDAEEVASWQYEPPYDIYNFPPEEMALLLDDANRYFAVHDDTSQLIGTCCFGAEARVPGGDYAWGEPDVLDVGVAMHPGLVGRGHGSAFVAAVLEAARDKNRPLRFRATIAAFNQRSRRTFAKLGFTETFSFEREGDDLAFIQVERDAVWQSEP